MSLFGSQELEDFRRRVISALGLWVGLLIGVVLPVRNWIAPVPPLPMVADLICVVGLMLLPVLNERKVDVKITGGMLILLLSAIGCISGVFNGGIQAPASVMFLITPVVGFFCIGDFGARLSLFLSIFICIGLFIAERYSWVLPLNHPEKYSEYRTLVMVAGTIISYLVGSAYERSRRNSEALIVKLTLAASQSSKMASLGMVSAGIAHEINNPLAILSGNLLLLKKHREDPEKFNEKIEILNKALSRISKTVLGLKRYSRSGDRLQFKTHRVIDIVREAVALTEMTANIDQIKVICEVNTNASIQCDDVEIEQVLLNLLGNALDAIKRASEKWIRVSVSEEDASVVIRVTDSGPGVPPEARSKIFEPFFTTKAVGEGTGLGLSISKGILDEHGASLTLIDAVPTCFEIRFKRAGIVS